MGLGALFSLRRCRKRRWFVGEGVRRMSKRVLFAVVASMAMLFCFGGSAYGQATGSFLGTVTDKSGSAVSGATVTVTSQATGAVRSAVTDETGHYVVNLLPVSVYTIR